MRKLVGWLTALLGAVGAMLLLLPGTASACEVRYAAAAASSCGDGTKVVAITATVAGSALGIAAVRQVIQVTSMSAQQLATADARVLDWALQRLANVGDDLEEVEAAEDELAEMRDAAQDGAEKAWNAEQFTENEMQHFTMQGEEALPATPLYDPITGAVLGISLGLHVWVFRNRLMIPIRRIINGFRN